MTKLGGMDNEGSMSKISKTTENTGRSILSFTFLKTKAFINIPFDIRLKSHFAQIKLANRIL